MNKMDIFNAALERYAGTPILCVGEVVLDRFIYGKTRRISSEAPIPVMLFDREKAMLGATGNVVANIKALGGEPILVSVVGNKSQDSDIRARLLELGIEDQMVMDEKRETTIKTRYLCKNQQMFRFDREKEVSIPPETEDKVIEKVRQNINRVKAVIISDYNQKILTKRLVMETIAIAREHDVPVIVDPRDPDYSRYAGATIVTPNVRELETVTNCQANGDGDIYRLAVRVMNDYELENVLVTRDKDGMSLISSSESLRNIPAIAKEVFDVSGAGDTVISALALGVANGEDMYVSAFLSNIAAGIVVGKLGTASTTVNEIRAVLHDAVYETNPLLLNKKIVSRKEAADKVEVLRAKGIKVGFTNGCFDLLHAGHLYSLRQAKSKCDFLVVGINSDASVKRLKGETRPVQSEKTRSEVLSLMEIVDLVVVFDEDTPLELKLEINPDILFKGKDYEGKIVPGQKFEGFDGSRYVLLDMEPGVSTSNTIKRMQS